ncbi:MAG TPA: SPOR domain-containing protein [Gemmatimonadales bacterium]|nr:SPOR domain-containing protein [Gemmatimonadales bacterium]
MKLSTTLLGAAVLSLAACGRETELAVGDLPAAGRGLAGATVLRVPAEGGTPRLYRVPALDSSAWTSEDKLPPLERTIGADPEQGLVFFLDKKRNVVALDLETRRVRPHLEQVRAATVGPDGALYAVDTGSAVTQLVRRAPIRFRAKLKGKPAELHGTMSGTLVARLAGNSPALELLGSDQPPETVPIPGGPIAPSFWGDLVAVAADSAVVIYQTQGKHERRVLPVSGHARAAMFSPSGHRIYVARDEESLLVLDRFSGDELQEIDLPGPAADLRADPYGQWIMVKPVAGDSAWIVDVGLGGRTGTVQVQWDDDLPAVVPPGTLVTRRGDDVVALDLGTEGFPERGSISGGAKDTWLPLAWQPQEDEGAAEPVDTALAAAADSAGPGRSVYLQVSSSQNPAWADELSQKLRTAGLPASVLQPSRSDEAYRVVLGPYATREQAEETGRRIGMPSFVVTPSDAPSR